MIRVAVLGDLLYDCFVWADRLPRKGETVTGYQSGFFAGGKGGNQAVACARLGANARMFGCVGADERGAFLLDGLSAAGIDVSGVRVDQSVSTGTCCVMVDAHGDNAIIVSPMANDQLSPSDAEEANLVDCGALLAQLQLRVPTVEAALLRAKRLGCVTVLDPAPAKPDAARLFPLADYILPNETEAEAYTGILRADYSPEMWRAHTCAKLREMGAKGVVLTLGEKGAYCEANGRAVYAPGFAVRALDSTAAGDAFAAEFTLRVSEGAFIDYALRAANAAGALATTVRGSQPSLPTRAEVDAILSNNTWRI